MEKKRPENSEAWESISSVRSKNPTRRQVGARALAALCNVPARKIQHFGRAPYQCWRGDIGAALMDSLLSLATGRATYPSKSIVFMEGQESAGIWLVCRGAVRLTRSSATGKNVTLYVAHAGAALGLSAAIANDPLRMAAQTAGPCMLAFVEREHLFGLMNDAQMGRLITETLASELQATYSGIGDLMLARSARGRVARVLLSAPPADALTHLQLAELASCSRETVTRMIGLMLRDGLIIYDCGGIRVLDHAAIEAICE